jgi:hypothetical protein
MEFNSDAFKSGGLHRQYAVSTWNLGTISASARRPVAGPSGYTLNSSPLGGQTEKMKWKLWE